MNLTSFYSRTTLVLLLVFVTISVSAGGLTKRILFLKGEYSSQYQGNISGYDYDTYTFSAKKGQRLKVELTPDKLYPLLFSRQLTNSVDLSKYSSDLNKDGSYTLPYSGKYEIRVLQMRNDARKEKKWHYNLQISIK